MNQELKRRAEAAIECCVAGDEAADMVAQTIRNLCHECERLSDDAGLLKGAYESALDDLRDCEYRRQRLADRIAELTKGASHE